MGSLRTTAMPQGKSALVKTATSKSAIQKKRDNKKLASKKKKLKSSVGGVNPTGKSVLFTNRGTDKASTAITKCIQRRIIDETHSRAAKKGSAFGVVKSSDQEGK